MSSQPEMSINLESIYHVTIQTPRGDIVLHLDPKLAPITVNNFVSLAQKGYYDGLTFHRVEPGFVIQGGCPEGSGRGGPGYRFADEPVLDEYRPGAVAMANAGPDTNGSQFFICLSDLTGKLPKQYNLFGYVTEGFSVVEAITRNDVMEKILVQEQPRS